MRRVVVTGLGMVSPIGNTVEESWNNALAGKSGIGVITHLMHPLSAAVLPVKLKILKSKNIFRQKKLAVSTVLFN